MNAGLFPAARGVAYTRYAPNEYNAIASALKGVGYSTIALHGDVPVSGTGPHVPGPFFDRFVSNGDFNVDSVIGL